MSNDVIELPDDLRAEIARRAAPLGLSQSAWVVEAVRQKLAVEEQMESLNTRAARGDRVAFDRVMAKVPAADPMPGDER